MSFFQVTASELRAKAQELETLNGNYKNQVAALETAEGALKSKWEGQANDTFHNAFMNDKGQMDKFHELVRSYITALLQIASEYEKAESHNVEVANQRTH